MLPDRQFMFFAAQAPAGQEKEDGIASSQGLEYFPKAGSILAHRSSI